VIVAIAAVRFVDGIAIVVVEFVEEVEKTS
jgi:hypothetical protein